MDLQRAGVIDQVVVVDESADETADIAASLGAEVYRQADLMPECGQVLGKGDAMWRALSVAQGEIVCFVDADSEDFGARLPCGLIGAIALGGARFAKGAYRRPFRTELSTEHTGGGRVTELTARPLIRALFPELLAFRQPLSGEIASERDLLERLPIATRYGVDIALLIDVWQEIGLGEMAEVDLDVRQNRHRPLQQLAVMAEQVVAVILARACAGQQTPATAELIERPALESHRQLLGSMKRASVLTAIP
jgi:glucosyl-3-phosphoglycerate synthase